jgi:hypothetical protein
MRAEEREASSVPIRAASGGQCSVPRVSCGEADRVGEGHAVGVGGSRDHEEGASTLDAGWKEHESRGDKWPRRKGRARPLITLDVARREKCETGCGSRGMGSRRE